jgi:hypothetical protein
VLQPFPCPQRAENGEKLQPISSAGSVAEIEPTLDDDPRTRGDKPKTAAEATLTPSLPSVRIGAMARFLASPARPLAGRASKSSSPGSGCAGGPAPAPPCPGAFARMHAPGARYLRGPVPRLEK